MSALATIRVVIVDDHSIVRLSLRLALRGEQDIEVVGDAADDEEALRVCGELHPDVVLMDLHLARGDSLEAILALQGQQPRLRVLLLTADDDPQRIHEALAAGACGYVLKQGTLAELVAAMRAAVDRAPAGGACAALQPAATAETPRQVLVAAASRRVRATLRVLLEAADYEVIEAADGVEAVDLLRQSPTPLVVVLDLLLPRQSGHQVLLRTSADPRLGRHAYAVVTTAGLAKERLSAQFAALLTEQAIPVLPRPLSAKQVLAVVGAQWARLRPPDEEPAASAAQA